MSLLKKALAAVVSAAFLVACAAGGGEGGEEGAGDTAKAQFSLPEPTGQYQVGTQEMHLVDQTRQDPWNPDRKREIMINVWYPAKDIERYPRQSWMSAGSEQAVDTLMAAGGIPKGSVDWTAAKTFGHVDAPRQGGKWPVVLYSPGLGGQRAMGTVLVQELASHGYVVTTIDHTFETTVEFPGGRIEKPVANPKDQLGKATEARVGDTRFVLDELGRRGWNLDKVGMFGHSFGGFTTAESMLADDRIDAGINMDGHLFTDLGDVAKRGLDQPFFLYGRQEIAPGKKTVEHSPFTDYDPTWGVFWTHQKGPKRSAVLPHSGHQSFTDMQIILPQLAKPLGLPADRWAGAIGTIDPEESIKEQSTAVLQFFQSSLS
ncbi:lipase [Streptomyces sp. GESEQ-35]|uniref:alpha/beta hydrolase family protein n=1 Tax=Streptomyces sp. GESEQ-35 TaxID=2812657 RepID=UPI001B3249C2|nr:lipase [Streptomyces sp. GESEQ-35]